MLFFFFSHPLFFFSRYTYMCERFFFFSFGRGLSVFASLRSVLLSYHTSSFCVFDLFVPCFFFFSPPPLVLTLFLFFFFLVAECELPVFFFLCFLPDITLSCLLYVCFLLEPRNRKGLHEWSSHPRTMLFARVPHFMRPYRVCERMDWLLFNYQSDVPTDANCQANQQQEKKKRCDKQEKRRTKNKKKDVLADFCSTWTKHYQRRFL